MAPELDQEFDPGTLHALRAKVLAQACRAGLSESRATDVVLAVHELAVNAIRHGAGAGRLRGWNLVRELCGQVDDVRPRRHPRDGCLQPVLSTVISAAASGPRWRRR